MQKVLLSRDDLLCLDLNNNQNRTTNSSYFRQFIGFMIGQGWFRKVNRPQRNSRKASLFTLSHPKALQLFKNTYGEENYDNQLEAVRNYTSRRKKSKKNKSKILKNRSSKSSSTTIKTSNTNITPIDQHDKQIALTASNTINYEQSSAIWSENNIKEYVEQVLTGQRHYIEYDEIQAELYKYYRD